MDWKRNRVEDTNDSAVVSKHSMASKGYVSDPFLHYFVADRQRRKSRSPLINRFYYLRFKAIEWAFSRLKDSDLIVSIGCGFDTSSLRMTDKRFVEIDFPSVVTTKAEILVENRLISVDYCNQWTQSDEPFVALRTNNYTLIGADLRNYRSLKQIFIDNKLLDNIDQKCNMCLFNECSLCYLSRDQSDRIIRTLFDLYADKCRSITYLGFEQLRPNQTNDGFSEVMLKHFQTIGSPLKTFLNKSEIICRFENLRFKSIEVLDMKTFYDCYIGSEERERIDSLEMFDEYEEFDSVANCYALTLARSDCRDMIENYSPDVRIGGDPQPLIESEFVRMETNPLLSRFGHSSCLSSEQNIVVFGGFGCDSNNDGLKRSHKRLSDIIKINTKTNETKKFIFAKNKDEIKGIHSQMVAISDQQFVVSGGRLSPNSIQNHKIVRLCEDSQTYEIQTSMDSIPKAFRHLMLRLEKSDKIIQFGGKQSMNRSESERHYYYRLDLNTLQSSSMTKTGLICDIHSLSGTALDPNVFVTNGGLNCDSSNSLVAHHLNIIDERMSSVIKVDVEDLSRLYSHQMICLDEKRLLIIGGIGECIQNNRIDSIDLRFNKIVNSLDIKTESTLMLMNFSSQLVRMNDWSRLWLIGGGGNCFSFGTHFNSSFSIDFHHLL